MYPLKRCYIGNVKEKRIKGLTGSAFFEENVSQNKTPMHGGSNGNDHSFSKPKEIKGSSKGLCLLGCLVYMKTLKYLF